ncbi:hypothetical protein [Thiomonas sp.]
MRQMRFHDHLLNRNGERESGFKVERHTGYLSVSVVHQETENKAISLVICDQPETRLQIIAIRQRASVSRPLGPATQTAKDGTCRKIVTFAQNRDPYRARCE